MNESNGIQREKGYLAEQEFIKLLEKDHIPYNYLDSWQDFTIYDVDIDVKSCILSHRTLNKRCKHHQYRIGRFDLTTRQQSSLLYLALFIRHENNFLFLGMLETDNNTPRYISIHKTRDLKLLTLKEFNDKIKKEFRRK